MSLTHRLDSPEPGLTTRWSSQMAGLGRYRTSRSESPHRGVVEERNLRCPRSPSPCEGDSPRSNRPRRSPLLSEISHVDQEPSSMYEAVSVGSIRSGRLSTRFRSREEAVGAIREWSKHYTEFKAPAPLEGIDLINREWLEVAILVCEVPSMARMRAWAAVCPITNIAVILFMAVACGVPFELYVDEASVDSIGVTPVFTGLMRKTLELLYAPGFSETHLSYGAGGGELYTRYSSQMLGLLSRPHATAFLYKGGVLSFIAQLYNEDLITRFLEGPTVQVREFHKGKSFWQAGREGRTRWTTDQVSDGEISAILGHVPTGDSKTETWLWPKPEWLEDKSDHFHSGAWNKEAYSFLKALENRIMVKKEYVWQTKKEWLRYISAGNHQAFTADYVPIEDDFKGGLALVKSTFPADWDKQIVGDIILPEEFKPS
ncbi:hypothetical protein K438DRAFT_1996075 [Mycena galopus ATCC 62051]|nr:hypothetical protein K438DRAFT_1996075 [Mycena galopus ATCC 62051]